MSAACSIALGARGAPLIAVATLLGCNSAMNIRTADLPRKGTFSGEAVYVAHYGQATVEAGGEEEPRPHLFENTDQGVYGEGLTSFWSVEGHYGLADRVELGAFFGAGKLGGELRIGALDEDDKDFMSLAASYGFGWNILGNGPMARVGVDLSRRIGGVFVPFANVYLSRSVVEESFSTTRSLCAAPPAAGPLCFDTFSERYVETRLSFGAGVAFAITSGRDAFFILGVEPYLPLSHESSSCKDCPHLRQEWGLYPMLGFYAGQFGK